MKSIYLAVDDVTLAKVKKLANRKKTSVAGLLRGYLRQLTSAPLGKEAARARLLQLAAASKGEVGPRAWSRGDLYDRIGTKAGVGMFWG